MPSVLGRHRSTRSAACILGTLSKRDRIAAVEVEVRQIEGAHRGLERAQCNLYPLGIIVLGRYLLELFLPVGVGRKTAHHPAVAAELLLVELSLDHGTHIA